MTLLQKIKSWMPDKRLIAAGAALVAAALLIPNTSHADFSFVGNIASGAIGWVVFYLEYIMATIAGALIALIVYFVGVLLQLNTQIVNDVTVQTGFGVTLSIANLAFILGIIVIAISTILRNSSYGMKQILWKLIVAAILVNFSLVICAPIISFADQLTSYFLTSVPGGGSGVSGFAQALAGAFTPQRAFLGLTDDGNSLGTTISGNTVQGNSGTSIANMLTPLISIVFVAGFLVIIVVVLAIFMFQLLMRYIWISMLLILMPLAWLGWVFPAFSGSWHKWWHHFIRWTFFAPLVTFFIWLAIVTSAQLGQLPALQGAAGNPVISGISSGIGSFVAGMAQSIMQMILVAGLAVGGMMAANSMGITAASTAVNAAKGTGNYFKNQAKKGGRLAYQGADKGVANLSNRMGGGKVGITQRLQEGRIGGLQYIPGVGKLAQKGATAVGHAVKKAQTNEELVAEAAKTVPHSSEDIKSELKGGLSLQKQFAYIAELLKQGKLDGSVKVGNQSVTEFMDSHGAAFERYGQGKLKKDIEKNYGGTKEMRDAEREAEAASKEVAERRERGLDTTAATEKETAALAKLNTETEKFVKDMDASDIRKIHGNTVFKEPASLIAKSLAANIAKFNPTTVPSLLGKMSGKTKKDFKKLYADKINELLAPIEAGYEADLHLPVSRATLRTQIDAKEEQVIRKEADLARARTTGAPTDTLENELKDLNKEKDDLEKTLKDATKKIDDRVEAEHENLAIAKRSIKKSLENLASGTSSAEGGGGAATP